MSYFTDDSPHKSTTPPLIVDMNNLPVEPLGFGAHLYKKSRQTFSAEHILAPTINRADALNECLKLIEDHSGMDIEKTLAPYGYKTGFQSAVLI